MGKWTEEEAITMVYLKPVQLSLRTCLKETKVITMTTY